MWNYINKYSTSNEYVLLLLYLLIISSDYEYQEEFCTPYFETLDIDLEQTEGTRLVITRVCF